MLPQPSVIKPVPVRLRFPNRYTGGYDSSIVTEKAKRMAQASNQKTPRNGNSDMGVIIVNQLK